MDYKNIPRISGILISNKMATLHELQTVYSLQDAYDMLEVLNVDSYNQKVLTPKE